VQPHPFSFSAAQPHTFSFSAAQPHTFSFSAAQPHPSSTSLCAAKRHHHPFRRAGFRLDELAGCGSERGALLRGEVEQGGYRVGEVRRARGEP
jgi:hypothetical protein